MAKVHGAGGTPRHLRIRIVEHVNPEPGVCDRTLNGICYNGRDVYAIRHKKETIFPWLGDWPKPGEGNEFIDTR
ncbi:uncharacterized protein PAC_01043 [Phialocephala subalpina]|uniref:Uncharacterized protein n=1 Tax=Phialocephala subalpina TaxID=576137 RepID=A0A1L7WEM0_9HELO|nr:uncharacterized protein PAC_01043 [Phialocephala subalpina]